MVDQKIIEMLDGLNRKEKESFIAFLRRLSAEEEPRSTAPRTVQEAAQRIIYIDLNETSGGVNSLYHQAIKEFILKDSWKSLEWMIDFTIGVSYAIGKQEGKRLMRQKYKNRKH